MTSNSISSDDNNVYADLCDIIANYTTKQNADYQAERILQDILNDSDNPNCVNDAIAKLKQEKPYIVTDREDKLKSMFQQWLDEYLIDMGFNTNDDFKTDLRNMFTKYDLPSELIDKLVDTMLALPINDDNSTKKIMDIINESNATTIKDENVLKQIEKEVSTFFKPKNNPEDLQYNSSVSFHKINKKNNYSNDVNISSDELLTPLSYTQQITQCIDDMRKAINDEDFNKSIADIVERLKNNEPIDVEKERMKLSPHCVHLTEIEPTPFDLQQRIDDLEKQVQINKTSIKELMEQINTTKSSITLNSNNNQLTSLFLIMQIMTIIIIVFFI